MLKNKQNAIFYSVLRKRIVVSLISIINNHFWRAGIVAQQAVPPLYGTNIPHGRTYDLLSNENSQNDASVHFNVQCYTYHVSRAQKCGNKVFSLCTIVKEIVKILLNIG